MFIDAQGNMYLGEMRLGDREATPEEIAAWEAARTPDPKDIARAEIFRLEEIQLRSSLRMERETKLQEAEAYALNNLGLTPEQLYAAALQPGAPVSFLTYKRMKDIDNAIKVERAKL